MIDIRDMFQWYKFVAPAIVRPFFWVATVAAVVSGLIGFTGGVVLLPDYPVIAVILVAFSFAVTSLGIMAARLIAELVLISFHTHGHINAIRDLAQPVTPPQTFRGKRPSPIAKAA